MPKKTPNHRDRPNAKSNPTLNPAPGQTGEGPQSLGIVLAIIQEDPKQAIAMPITSTQQRGLLSSIPKRGSFHLELLGAVWVDGGLLVKAIFGVKLFVCSLVKLGESLKQQRHFKDYFYAQIHFAKAITNIADRHLVASFINT